MLSLKNLTINSSEYTPLSDITASFTEGEIAGITGGSGSGKSTLIKLIAGKIASFEGDILLNDSSIHSLGSKERSRLISHYHRSENSINPEATVEDWIIGGRIHYRKRLNPYSDTDREIANREMSLFGLEKFTAKRLKHLSSSTVQMASIARAFCAQSGILLLEKPDAGLDLSQRRTLVNALKKYTSAGTSLVILTSSDLNFISSVCDRIIFLAGNTIAETGTHGIITSDLIKRYFNIEAVVTRNIYTGLPEIQVIE